MKNINIFAVAVCVMVAAVALTGLFLAGSPSKERERRFDDTRVSNLQQIASAVDQYTMTNGKVPASLDELVKPETARLYYISAIADPETSVPYEYTATADRSYRLCATFTQSSNDANAKTSPVMADPYAKVWAHPAGAHCFDLVAPPKPVAVPPIPIK